MNNKMSSLTTQTATTSSTDASSACENGKKMMHYGYEYDPRIWRPKEGFKSNVWKYFLINIQNEREALCLVDGVSVTWNGTSPFNLTRWLVEKHNSIALKEGLNKDSATSSTTDNNSAKITSHAYFKGPELEECHRLLAAWLCVEDRPYEMTRGSLFRQFCYKISRGRYIAPCCDTLRRHIDAMDLELVRIVERTLEAAIPTSITLSMDGWTTTDNNEHYLGVNAHFLNKDGLSDVRCLPQGAIARQRY
jgi:hypothetical protein